MKKTILILALLGAASLASAYIVRPVEHWPPHQPTAVERALGAEAAKTPARPAHIVTPYLADGPYMNWGIVNAELYRNDARMKLDADGLPMPMYNGRFWYNPVTLSQFALMKHHRYLMGESVEPFIKAVDKLLELQRADGAFPYPFAYKHLANPAPYAPGWVSGMAQGQALSALGRAWLVTKDKRYLEAGEKSLAFLQEPWPKGPMTTLADLDPSLAGYSFILEYPVKPNDYTLNGYVFALIGLYDWWKIAGSDRAGDLFADGVRTLEKLLPYYDIGTFTTYDIAYVTQALEQPYLIRPKPYIHTGYHSFHIELCEVMFSITGKQVFKAYAEKWKGYVRNSEP